MWKIIFFCEKIFWQNYSDSRVLELIKISVCLSTNSKTNRETISTKRIENSTYLSVSIPSSLSSIISDIFTRISCLCRSFDSIRYRGNTYWSKGTVTFLYLSALSGPHERRIEFFSIHESLGNRGNKYR